MTPFESLRAGKAPLPLGDGVAISQAVRLRRHGMTYRHIAMVMGIYHDQWYSADRWSEACRARGIPADRRRNTFQKKAVAG
jgi:hypothetical protein